MRLYILQLGSLQIEDTWVLQDIRPSCPPRFVEVPVWAALLRTEERNILFDLGCMENAMQDGWTEEDKTAMPFSHTPEQTLKHQLHLAGINAKDVDTVIVSHLHADHFGNIGMFPHAEVYVPKENWVEALMLVHGSSDPAAHGGFYQVCVEAPVKRYHPVSIGEDFTLLSGVELLTLPGHSIGLLGMAVTLRGEGCFIFPSDALYTPENFGPPVRPSACADEASYIRSVEKLRRLQAERGGKLMFSHDLVFYNTLKKAPDYYE